MSFGEDVGALRAEDLVYAGIPGLPTREEVAREAAKPQKDKAGLEIAQGEFLGAVLADPVAGTRLVEKMLEPIGLDRLDELRGTGRGDLGAAGVGRRGDVGVLERRNPRHLNAEDDTTLPASETAVDLMLADPAIEICVLRGGVVEHPRYAGRRILGAGLNLTHLYQGRISYLFFPVRDLGFVNKVFRGDKLWIAAAETYAIGGACQLLLAGDHNIAPGGRRPPPPATPRRGGAAASRCRPATRASSRVPRTCGCRASSATARRAGRSSRARSSRCRTWPTRSWRRARWTTRSRPARRR